MLNKLSLINMMSNMATHASTRHAVIADNIANANTPGYKAKDIQSFSDLYGAFELSYTNDLKQNLRPIQMETVATPSPDGNTVSLEEQMLLSAQVKADHELAISVYKKSLEMMRMAIGKNL